MVAHNDPEAPQQIASANVHRRPVDCTGVRLSLWEKSSIMKPQCIVAVYENMKKKQMHRASVGNIVWKALINKQRDRCSIL